MSNLGTHIPSSPSSPLRSNGSPPSPSPLSPSVLLSPRSVPSLSPSPSPLPPSPSSSSLRSHHYLLTCHGRSYLYKIFTFSFLFFFFIFSLSVLSIQFHSSDAVDSASRDQSNNILFSTPPSPPTVSPWISISNCREYYIYVSFLIAFATISSFYSLYHFHRFAMKIYFVVSLYSIFIWFLDFYLIIITFTAPMQNEYGEIDLKCPYNNFCYTLEGRGEDKNFNNFSTDLWSPLCWQSHSMAISSIILECFLIIQLIYNGIFFMWGEEFPMDSDELYIREYKLQQHQHENQQENQNQQRKEGNGNQNQNQNNLNYRPSIATKHSHKRYDSQRLYLGSELDDPLVGNGDGEPMDNENDSDEENHHRNGNGVGNGHGDGNSNGDSLVSHLPPSTLTDIPFFATSASFTFSPSFSSPHAQSSSSSSSAPLRSITSVLQSNKYIHILSVLSLLSYLICMISIIFTSIDLFTFDIIIVTNFRLSYFFLVISSSFSLFVSFKIKSFDFNILSILFSLLTFAYQLSFIIYSIRQGLSLDNPSSTKVNISAIHLIIGGFLIMNIVEGMRCLALMARAKYVFHSMPSTALSQLKKSIKSSYGLQIIILVFSIQFLSFFCFLISNVILQCSSSLFLFSLTGPNDISIPYGGVLLQPNIQIFAFQFFVVVCSLSLIWLTTFDHLNMWEYKKNFSLSIVALQIIAVSTYAVFVIPIILSQFSSTGLFYMNICNTLSPFSDRLYCHLITLDSVLSIICGVGICIQFLYGIISLLSFYCIPAMTFLSKTGIPIGKSQRMGMVMGIEKLHPSSLSASLSPLVNFTLLSSLLTTLSFCLYCISGAIPTTNFLLTTHSFTPSSFTLHWMLPFTSDAVYLFFTNMFSSFVTIYTFGSDIVMRSNGWRWLTVGINSFNFSIQISILFTLLHSAYRLGGIDNIMMWERVVLFAVLLQTIFSSWTIISSLVINRKAGKREEEEEKSAHVNGQGVDGNGNPMFQTLQYAH